jgi:hypothetical protein
MTTDEKIAELRRQSAAATYSETEITAAFFDVAMPLIDSLQRERDAAVKERDELKLNVNGLTRRLLVVNAKRDALARRVAELEAAIKGIDEWDWSVFESVEPDGDEAVSYVLAAIELLKTKQNPNPAPAGGSEGS